MSMQDLIDTGMGIPEDKKGSLFQSFSQVDTSTTRKFGGTGLGLAISRQLAEMMGGTVGLESEEGQGSLFWFTVRLGIQDKQQEDPAPACLQGVRILIVDDKPTNREILMVRLGSWGMRPEEASDGPFALSMLHQARADDDPFVVAVLDMQMPEMDGLEATRRIRESEIRRQSPEDTSDSLDSGQLRFDFGSFSSGRIPIIAMTAAAMQQDRDNCLEAGMDDYLAKPIQPRALAALLQRYLGPQEPLQAADPGQAESSFHVSQELQDVFHEQDALERFDNDASLLQELLEQMVQEIPQRLEGIKNTLQNGDLQSAHLYAHTLKGIAGNLSAPRLQDAASRLESMGAAGDLSRMQELMPEVEKELETLKQVLEKYLSSKGA